MKIINSTNFKYAFIPGRLNYPGNSLTHIVKATFDLKPDGTVKLAEEQLLPNGDEYYPDDEEQTGSLFYESDFAYIKPKADVLLVGKCHTPGQQLMHACNTKITVGEYSKSLAVYGNRFWKRILISPTSTEPQPFTQMDLRYERSFGGKSFKNNPIGRGACKDDVTVADNVLPVPNIQDPDDLVTSPFQKKFPAGYGPLNRNWDFRSQKLGIYNKSYQKNRWPWFPDDMQQDYFNAAPPDQQFKGFLKGGEALHFENLHSEHSVYKSQLPGLRVRCFTRVIDPQTKKRFFDEVDLNLDTLWVDMEAEKLVLVWRGWSPVLNDEFEELQHVFLMSETIDEEFASIESCYEQFCKAREEEEAEFEGEKSEKETADKQNSKKLKLDKVAPAVASAPGVAQADEEVVIKQDQVELENKVEQEIEAFSAKSGLDVATLPEEFQIKLNDKKQALIAKLTKADAEQYDKIQQEEGKALIAKELAKFDLDIDNLPPLTEKARQERIKLINELGIDKANLPEADAANEEMWTIMAAVLSKMGVDPENLTPFIESNQETLAEMKEKIQPAFSHDKTLAGKQNAANVENENLHRIKQRAADNESLAGEVLDGLDLSGLDFSNCDLTKASFVGANLKQASFSGANISQAIFRGARLNQANLSQVQAKGADFTQAELNECLAEDADFSLCLFTEAKLRQTQFSRSTFVYASLVKSVCFQSQFKEATLDNADFSQASLVEADFSAAKLNNTAFEKIVANDSQWKAAKGNDTVFLEAELANTDFSLVEFQAADFSGATLSNANFNQCQLKNVFMENVKADNIDMSESDLFKLRASRGSDFTAAKLMRSNANESNWDKANLAGADFSFSSLQFATFVKADLSSAGFYEANLKFARFNAAKLNSVDMRFVNLMQGSLEKADLTLANLYGSNLYEVEFLDAILDQTNVESANLDGTKLES